MDNIQFLYVWNLNSRGAEISTYSVQFRGSVVSNSVTPMNHSTPGLPVHHQLLEFTQTHVRWVGDAIQPSHPLSSPSPPPFNLSQHQGLFQWCSSSHQVTKILEFQLQHQTFQWSIQFSSVQLLSCVRLCDSMNHSTPGFPVHHQLPEFTQTHVHRVGDAIQPSHPLSSPSPPASNPSQHQGLFQLVNSSHEVAKVLEFQL